MIEHVERCLARLNDLMVMHFHAEEADGYFGTLTADVPGLGPTVERLLAEHGEFIRTIDALRTAIRDVDEGELGRSIEVFIGRLTAHEREESALLGRFLAEDHPGPG